MGRARRTHYAVSKKTANTPEQVENPSSDLKSLLAVPTERPVVQNKHTHTKICTHSGRTCTRVHSEKQTEASPLRLRTLENVRGPAGAGMSCVKQRCPEKRGTLGRGEHNLLHSLSMHLPLTASRGQAISFSI